METQLQGILGRLQFGPSESLASMFRACTRDLTVIVSERLREMLHLFMQHHGDAGSEITVRQVCRAVALYYGLLEAIINQEKRKLGSDGISVILQHDMLQRCVVVCCLEIVTFSQRLCNFPLFLQTFNLPPYHFYKVIELVLRVEEVLPPAVVQHLSRVERNILESLVWTRDSPLWHVIRAHQGPLPACQQVMLTRHFEDLERLGQNSNWASSDMDGSDRNQLAGGYSSARQPHTASIFQAGQIVVTMAAATVTTNSGQMLTIPVQLCLNLQAPTLQQHGRIQQSQTSTAVSRLHGTSSLCLFLRKVYSLMSLRLKDLCSRLGISSDLCVKIWTFFEHSLVHCTELMLDRHLDQLLMCAIYITCRITREDMTFKRIMKCYNARPHASKSVYKNVLISGIDSENSPASTSSGHNAEEPFLTPSTPSTHTHGPNMYLPNREERGNLIHFYNQVYCKQMRQFAIRFSSITAAVSPALTPFPRPLKASPRRVLFSSHQPFYVSLLRTEADAPDFPRNTVHYIFGRSPSTRLHQINSMVRAGEPPTRSHRVGPVEDEGEEDSSPLVKKFRLQDESAWQRRLWTMVGEQRQSRGPATRPGSTSTAK